MVDLEQSLGTVVPLDSDVPLPRLRVTYGIGSDRRQPHIEFHGLSVKLQPIGKLRQRGKPLVDNVGILG